MRNHMKWWGWGHPDVEFDVEDKPDLWPFIVERTGVDPDRRLRSAPPVSLDAISLPEPKKNHPFLEALSLPISFDVHERVIHSYGKSYRDLWRIRQGLIEKAPDGICYPQSEEEVVQVLRLAHLHNVVVIPFGGGSNIAGCLEVRETEERMVLSLDLRQMNRVLKIDATSRTAEVEAGAMGPELEESLNQAQMTLGHFPDSFQFSSLGGWVATRSAGMQSDKYGKIEDMVIALRLVTPQGKIITRKVPKSSNGIDLKHLCMGSEGILGVITQITVQLHPLPKKKEYCSYLFPTFEQGVAAIYECAARGVSPSMTRLNDPEKTALSFAFKTKGSKGQSLLGKLVKFYLKKMKRMDFQKVSLLLVCYESDQREADLIYKRFGAVSLGAGPGKNFEKGKYDFPYIRDFAMDRGIIADVSETSTVWSNLLPLYQKAKEAITQAMASYGVKPFCSCHISHTYHTGASLYFTFACRQKPTEGISQYLGIKKAAEDAFMQHGGTLSHHHAVGFEHQPWMLDEISATGIEALIALKQGLDPKGIMNPGKIIPDEMTLQYWHAK